MLNHVMPCMLVVLLGTVAPSQAQTALAWRVGDTWSYQQEDMWNKQVLARSTLTVTGLDGQTFVMRTDGGQLAFEERVSADGTHERPRVGIIDAFAHTPFRFPLKVGDSWPTSSRFQHSQGDIRKRELTCRA